MNLLNFSLSELEDKVVSDGFPKYRAKQLFDSMLRSKPLSESNLPTDIKEFYKEEYPKCAISLVKSSKDGTKKYIFKLHDGEIVEGVFLPYNYGNTLCISTQVGCRMGCTFCASGLNGLIRNLEAGEMLEMVYLINADNQKTQKETPSRFERLVTNIVLMGSGEPLDNYDNVVKFIKLLNEKSGLGISQRNISLSTCGLVKKIYELADAGLSVTLTISLHASKDDVRKKLMKVANSYSISEIIKAVRYYFDKTGRRIVFEYILIDGVNDALKDAEELSRVLRGLPCHVNLIPLNSVEENAYKGTERKKAYAFMQRLIDLKISATVRRTMGEDIDGACGQLRNKFVLQNTTTDSSNKTE